MKENKIIDKNIFKEPAEMENITKEEVQEIKEDLVAFEESKKQMEADLKEKDNARAEEDLKVDKKTTENNETKQAEQIKKLKCNYEVFKTERNKSKMRAPENCDICKKKFKDNAPIYVALDKKLSQIFICEKCAENNQQKNT